MKKIGLLFLIGLTCFFLFFKKGKEVKNIALSYVTSPNYINEDGITISERILLPENFKRITYPENSFSEYIQNYALLPFDSEVINYDGNPYIYQQGHVGVLDVSVPSHGLMQCADVLIRLRAEYLWKQNRKDEIGFNFTSGHYCSWKKYAEGYRPKINGNNVTFQKTAGANASQENFYNYLDLIYTYAGTMSLYAEMKKISTLSDIEVGDMLIYPGSPGHVIMVADKAIHSEGKILFIFAQGNTPSQSMHVLKNLNDLSKSPWYEIELGASLQIPTYTFDEVKFIRFK
ncbi:MAG: DUF4846 domain-containing protein [Flavobacteriaceae bacterium]